MSFIGRSWKGEEPLWKVFWLYGVLLGIVVNILVEIIKDMQLGQWVTLGALGFRYLVYGIWLIVSQWRCAFNANWSIWGYIIRTLLFIGVCSYIFVMGSILMGASVAGFDVGKMLTWRSTLQETSPECVEFVKRRPPKTDIEAQRIFDQQNAAEVERCGKIVLKAMGMESVLKNFKDSDGRPSDAPRPDIRPAPVQTVKTAPKAASAHDADMVALFTQSCTNKMKADARKQGNDPERYVTENQAAIAECVARRVQNLKE